MSGITFEHDSHNVKLYSLDTCSARKIVENPNYLTYTKMYLDFSDSKILLNETAIYEFGKQISEIDSINSIDEMITKIESSLGVEVEVRNNSEEVKQLANDLQEANTFQLNSSKDVLRKILYETNAQELVNLYGDTFETPLLTNDGIVIPEIGLKDALQPKEYLNKVPIIAGSNKDEIKLWLGLNV